MRFDRPHQALGDTQGEAFVKGILVAERLEIKLERF